MYLNEGLMFTFSQPVLLKNVYFTLVGFQDGVGSYNNDQCRIAYHNAYTRTYASSGVFVPKNAVQAIEQIALSKFWPNDNTTYIDKLWIQSANTTTFGVGAIITTPIPGAAWLLLSGVIGLVGFRRFKK